MPKYEVMRTILEKRVIEADTPEEAERLMSNYGPNDVDATATDLIAEQVSDDTPLPTETDPEERSVILTGNPVDGFSIIGPFNTRDEAFESGENDLTLRDADWWVAHLQTPHTEDHKQ